MRMSQPSTIIRSIAKHFLIFSVSLTYHNRNKRFILRFLHSSALFDVEKRYALRRAFDERGVPIERGRSPNCGALRAREEYEPGSREV